MILLLRWSGFFAVMGCISIALWAFGRSSSDGQGDLPVPNEGITERRNREVTRILVDSGRRPAVACFACSAVLLASSVLVWVL